MKVVNLHRVFLFCFFLAVFAGPNSLTKMSDGQERLEERKEDRAGNLIFFALQNDFDPKNASRWV